MARLSRFARPTCSRRKLSWGSGPSAADVAISTSDTNTLWTLGSLLAVDSESTIVRTHGIASLFLRSATAQGDGYLGAIGIGITTIQAFTTGGATSCPDPQQDPNWDGWLFHQFFDLRAITATLADGVNANAVVAKVMIDSKAKRILNDDMVIFGAISGTESGTAVLELQARTRILLMLP